MRFVMFLVIIITVTLITLIIISAPNTVEAWTPAVLLFVSSGILWITISASFYEQFNRAKSAKNQPLAVTLAVLILATVGVALDNFYATILTLSAKNIIFPFSWYQNFFDKPLPWSVPAVVYNLVAVLMLLLFQRKVFEQVLADQEQRKLLEETTQRLEEKNRILATIEAISRALNQSLDLRTILDELTHQVVRYFKVDMCTVRLVTAQKELVVEAAYGENATRLLHTSQKVDEGISGWVFTQQRIAQINDVYHDPRVAPEDFLRKMKVFSYIGLPLNLPLRGTLGCLEIYTYTVRQFTADEVEAFTLIANEAAIAIQNARNFEEAERHRKELEALNQFSSLIDASISESEIYRLFLNEISKRFEVSQVIILQKSSEADFLEIATSLNPLTKKQAQLPILEDPHQCRAIRTGKEMVVANVQTDIICDCELLVPKQGSYFCHPLIIGGKILGLVHLASPKTDYWDTDKQRIVAAFAATIAPAIANLQLMAQEKTRAITDQLTQVHNRRFLDEYLAKQLHILKRQQAQTRTPLAILMLDLDHFKYFNDNFGHEVGDQVLQNFGRMLVATVRASDLVARYGGEEFCVILTGTDLAGAIETAEKIRSATERLDVSSFGAKAPKKITVSIGIAVYPDHGTNPQDLLKKSDQALYAAKEAGRNRICIAELNNLKEPALEIKKKPDKPEDTTKKLL
ncbi:MAG: diguanylate cyclase [bacterium]|nr:diguanylate cyclase [bacterium]